MTKKRVISLSLSILLFLSMILSPFGNLILPSVIEANAATTNTYYGKAKLNHIYLSSNYKDEKNYYVAWDGSNDIMSGEVYFWNDGSPIGGRVIRGKKTQAQYSELKLNKDGKYETAYIACNSNGSAVPQSYWNGIPYTLTITTTETTTATQKTITKNYTVNLHVKSIPDYSSYQNIIMNWKETEKKPLFGYFKMNKTYYTDSKVNDFVKKFKYAYKKECCYSIQAKINNEYKQIAEYHNDNGNSSYKITYNYKNSFSIENNKIKINFDKLGTNSLNIGVIELDKYGGNLIGRGWTYRPKTNNNMFFTAKSVTPGKTVDISNTNNIGYNSPVIININAIKKDENGKPIANRSENSGTNVNGIFNLYYSQCLSTENMKKRITRSQTDARTCSIKVNNDRLDENEQIQPIATAKIGFSTGYLKFEPTKYATDRHNETNFSYVNGTYFRGPIGSYVLVEKCSPQGYAINFNENNDTNNYITWDFYNDSNRTINATYNGTTNTATKDKVSFTYHRLSSNINGSKSIKNTHFTEIAFKKATNDDSNNIDIANLPYYSYTKAKYDILYNNNKVCTATVNKYGTFKLSNKTDYATNTLKVKLSDNKISNINKDLNGIWSLKETQPAKGYAKNNITYFKYDGTNWVELTKTGSTYSVGNPYNTISIKDNVITDYETPIKVKIDMKKLVDESDSDNDRKSASGAWFNLYYCSLDRIDDSTYDSTSEYFKENLEITPAQIYNGDNINIIGSYKQRSVKNKSDDIYLIGQFEINKDGNAIIKELNKPYIKGISYSFNTERNTEGGSIISNLPLGYYCLIEVRTPTTKAGNNNTTISYKFSDVSRMYTWIMADKDGNMYTRQNDDYLESSEITKSSSNTNLLTNQTFKVTFKPNDDSNKSKPVEKSFTLLKTSNIPVSVENAEYSVYYSKNKITGSHTKIRNTLINSSNLYVGKFKINNKGEGIVTENKIVHETNIKKFKITNVNNSTTYKECATKGYFYIIETKRARSYAISNLIKTINVENIGKSYEISDKEPPYYDPLKLSITKTINNKPTTMTDADLRALLPLKNTEFTLDFYPGANKLSDIKNIEPDISIKYKTKYNEAHKRYEIDFKDKNYISNINELTNLNTYITNGIEVSFPIGIYRITETGASSDKFNLENTIWKDTRNGSIINTRDIGLLFKVVDDGSLTEINASLTTYMYDYHHNTWQTNSISTNINFEKPNNINNGGFKLKKNKLYISNDANDIYNFNIEPFSNIKFKIYPIADNTNITSVNRLIKNNDFFDNQNKIINYNDNLQNAFIYYYKDSNNNIIDKPIAEITTNSNGEASTNNLPVGKYLVVEQYDKNVNKGYILSKPFCIKIEKDVVNDYYYNEDPINNTKQDIKSIEFDKLSQSQNSHLTFKNQEKANIKDELFISGLKLNTKFIIKSVVMRINNNGTIEPVVKDDIGSLYTKNTKITTNKEESYVNTIINLGKIDVDKLFTTNTKFVVYDFIFKYTDSEFNTLLTKETINKLISKVNNNPVTNAITNIDNTRYFGHYDNSDSNQIGKLVSVSTQASDKNSKTKMIYLKDTNINIIDKLNYTNFEPNTKYTSIVKIKDFDTDEDLYTVNKKFTTFTTNNSGTGTYIFDNINFNSTIIPENTNKIYVTHDIYLNNKEFISHEDLTDKEKEAQSCVFPRISTRLITNKLLYLNESTVNTYNGILCSTPNKNTTITDTVYYINLLPGEYRVTLTLVDENGHTIKNKNNNKLQITKQFTLTSSNQTDLIEGQFVMELTNVDTRQFVGKKIIAYEQVDYLSNMGYRTIAEEMDVNNKDQSQYFIDTRIVINKTDFNGKLLDNAIFNLYKKDKNNNYVIKEQNIKINSNNISSTIFTFAEPGEYKLVEIKSPSKYALNTDLYFNVKFDAKTLKYKVYKVENGNEIKITDTTTIDDEVLPLITFKDAPLTRLPSAGGEGTTVYIVFGMLLMSCSVLYIYRKKRKV